MVDHNVHLEQQPTPPIEVWQRIARTGLQLLVAGGLTALTDQIASDLPVEYSAYFVIFYTIVVTAAQNYLESINKIPTILKKADR
jgi:hypothetical protein